MTNHEPELMEKVVSLCKRRGFIFQGSEIYGGLANTWDYGPYGVELKKNVKSHWWKTFVQERDDIVGLDAAILMNPKVWEASGHTESFTDPLMDCKKCHERIRGDKLIEEHMGLEAAAGKSLDEISKIIHEKNLPCPNCGQTDFTEARSFNLMFKTYQGVLEDTASLVYLRPETAQGIFVNFKSVQQVSRKKLPFGIAQIGKAFRNEITPGNFTYRTREFEMMEIEYFIKPPKSDKEHKEVEKLFNEWKEICMKWYVDLGIKSEKLRFRDHEREELSHYSSMTCDIEYKFPFGWGELEGIAYRTDYDIKRHMEFSKEDLMYFDQDDNEKYIPHVIEPSFGSDRSVLTFLIDAYDEDEIEGEKRTVMRFHPHLAPVKIAILPLMRKKELTKKAREIFDDLKINWNCEYDEVGSIGKRYRRHDEIGTPYAITVDYETLDDNDVTVRDRDTTKQERIKIDDLKKHFSKKL